MTIFLISRAKLLCSILTLFLLLFFISCRKEVVDREKEDFFDNGCEISSFQLSQNSAYTLDYETPNILKGYLTLISRELAFEAYLSNGKLLKVEQGSLPFQRTSAMQFEYDAYSLKKITFFNVSFYSINNDIDSLDEMSKVEFKYNQMNKPVSMTYSSLENSGGAPQKKYKVVFNRNFEFDQVGNLVKEITFRPNLNGEMELAQTSTHQYDDNRNSCRQLNYLFFDSELSAPYIFSDNNKISTQTSYGPQNSNVQDFKMLYDDKNYVSDDGIRFSKIMWNCK